MSKKNEIKKVSYCLISPDTDEQTQLALARYQLIYSAIGLLLGLACVVGGMYLFIIGINSDINWSIKVLESESTLVNAAPGAMLFLVGLIVVYVTKFKFTHISLK
ncbi:TPA: hypothetical protein NKU61_004441 [Vibrio parahaemolyticus]|nr:hypothetical protein [Vibrio parahaemolyticus]